MSKFKNIKVIFSDVDGTLTDGRLYYGENGENLKVFHVKDGHGIKAWQKAGNKFCIITARSSNIIIKRMNELGVEDIIMSSSDKARDASNWLAENKLTWANAAFIGDDINDIEAMKMSAASAAPADSAAGTLKSAAYICRTPGGMGAVREFIDYLMETE